MISCLTITREHKFVELKRALGCFYQQTVSDKELIIVHDGSAYFNRLLVAETDRYEGDAIVVHQTKDRDLTLGALRNIALSLARGEFVCQWDDDDLYHPKRLEVQLQELMKANADFCFLTDQLHFFEPTGELFWDDWEVEGYPGNLIQGTILGRADKIGKYEWLPRGEDTHIVRQLLANGCHLIGIANRGYLCIYVFNGKNAWDIQHHAAISAWKRLDKTQLLRREDELRRHLSEYELPWKRIFMPYVGGALNIR